MATSPAPSAGFMLLFRNAGPEAHQHLDAAAREQLTRQWNDWYDGLAAAGQVLHGQPLALERRVLSGPGGERLTDGPFAEASEAVGGYFLLTVASLDEATVIARQCPGLAHGVIVEVRALAGVSPVLTGVHGRPPR